MENFHIDILENILFRLPFTATLQARQVCKAWKTHFANRCCNEGGFLISYYRSNKDVELYYGEQYDQIHGDVQHRTKLMNYYYGRFSLKYSWDNLVVGSCNGLVCLRKRDERDGIQYVVCNPLTGEYVFVPQFDYTSLQNKDGVLVRRKSWLRHQSASDGLGYCHSTNQYKVVRIHLGNILVYTIGSHKWRNIGTMPHNLPWSRGVFANGVLHWLTSGKQEEQRVFGFDLEGEKIRLLQMPSCARMVYGQLKLLGGNLCFVGRESRDHCACIEIWAYKNMKEHNQSWSCYDNNSWNWIKESHIDPVNDGRFEPFAVTRRNQVLLWHNYNTLYSYDPNASSTLTRLWDCCMDYGAWYTCIEAIPHTNSFVSLKDLGESGAKSYKYETRGYPKQAKRKRSSMVEFELVDGEITC
ncbi:putative F-box/kelch-repeat protein At1g13200 [Papaver somniferum]|uniref:putative F-box/kelch-repeat protein At1g13200 n=1 Tax=Papaver somniferum TaxID=3469 RepID=UPI000E6F8F74|nr:putative F-box/kelch-repeat protein At1g13200 [Papaver somniferum]